MTPTHAKQAAQTSEAKAIPAAVPLATARIGEQFVLVGVNGGRGLLHRLAELGIRPGARFSVLNKGRSGPFIISMRHIRLILGQGLVHRMMVRPA